MTDTDRELALSELIEYLATEPERNSVIHAHTQSFGTIDLLLISTTELLGSVYYLFCELDNSVPVVDANGVMHLIILRGEDDRGLVTIVDRDELDKVADEFYCLLLAETDIQIDDGSEPMTMELESVRDDTVTNTLEIESVTDIPEVDGNIAGLPEELAMHHGGEDNEAKDLSDDDVLL